MLNVASLTFTYNSHTVLDTIDFSLPSGKLLAVLGPNGAGKTTLLKCINAIFRPAKETVYVDRHDVLSLSPRAVARKVGYVAQQNETSRVTAFDAVLMGRRPHVKWGVSKNDLKIVAAALKRVGLTQLSMRYIDEMSGGEVQKVAIARALVQEPGLMLLDEPTSSLDLRNQVDILETIRQVVTAHKVAVVMTMHDLNTALHYADECIFLKEGKIFYTGPSQTVDANVIEAVYGLAVDVYRHGSRLVIAPK